MAWGSARPGIERPQWTSAPKLGSFLLTGRFFETGHCQLRQSIRFLSKLAGGAYPVRLSATSRTGGVINSIIKNNAAPPRQRVNHSCRAGPRSDRDVTSGERRFCGSGPKAGTKAPEAGHSPRSANELRRPVRHDEGRARPREGHSQAVKERRRSVHQPKMKVQRGDLAY